MMVERLEKKIIAFVIFVTAVITIGGSIIFQAPAIAINQNGSNNRETKGISDRVTKIEWQDLSKLDYKTGKAPDYLKKLHKTRVKIVGFLIPLSDDISSLKEFLLVPYAQACIHVPPPPPNLIVYTILDKAIPIEKVPKCALVEGVLLIEKSEGGDVPAAYKIFADKISEF